MVKTRRQIEEDLKLIDVVIELLDSRIPISSRNPEIQKITKNNKRIILLNKADLADENTNKKWVQELSKEAPTILTDSNSGKGIDKVSKQIELIMRDEIARQAARGRINKTIRVMILGIPNVGKSSFINRISKKSNLEVGNRPGVTKQKQWIRIGKNQELLDTPGVLWPKFQSEEIALNLAFTYFIDSICNLCGLAFELFTKFVLINNSYTLSPTYAQTNGDNILTSCNSFSLFINSTFYTPYGSSKLIFPNLQFLKSSNIILAIFSSSVFPPETKVPRFLPINCINS